MPKDRSIIVKASQCSPPATFVLGRIFRVSEKKCLQISRHMIKTRTKGENIMFVFLHVMQKDLLGLIDYLIEWCEHRCTLKEYVKLTHGVNLDKINCR